MGSEKEAKTDLGNIKIHTHAISAIAAIATLEIDGVVRIQQGLIGKLLEFLGRDANSVSAKIELKENNEVNIAIGIIIRYGEDISTIANLVQENIRHLIEKMTGLIPANIDVKVKGVVRKS